ncbi:MAG: hypothetical protein ACHQIL_00020 [Steroidobacterales bacterium]
MKKLVDPSAAEYLVTGDKFDILSLKTHGNTRIINPTSMLRKVGIRE